MLKPVSIGFFTTEPLEEAENMKISERRSLTIQRSLPLTTAELDKEMSDIHFAGGTGLQLCLHPSCILELIHIAEELGAITMFNTTGVNASRVIGLTVTDYLHPVTGEMIHIEANVFMGCHDFNIQYTQLKPCN